MVVRRLRMRKARRRLRMRGRRRLLQHLELALALVELATCGAERLAQLVDFAGLCVFDADSVRFMLEDMLGVIALRCCDAGGRIMMAFIIEAAARVIFGRVPPMPASTDSGPLSGSTSSDRLR